MLTRTRLTALLGTVAVGLALSASLDLGPDSAANAADGVKIDPNALGINGPAAGGTTTGADPWGGQGSGDMLPPGQDGAPATPVMIESVDNSDDGAFKHEFLTSGAIVRQAYQSSYDQDVTVTYRLQWQGDAGWVNVPDAAPVTKTATIGQGVSWAMGAASWTLPLSYTDLPDTDYRVTNTATWSGTTGDAKGFELATKTITPQDVQPAVRCSNDELTCSENQTEGYLTV
jgi:hypothetical protein